MGGRSSPRSRGRRGNATLSPAVEQLALWEELLDLADPGYRDGAMMVAPTAQLVHGVRTPALRGIARRWTRSNKGKPAAEVLALIEALWDGESRDERALGLEILNQYPNIVVGLNRSRFDRWRRDIDNWVICDFLGYRILGPWVLVEAERLEYLDRLIADRGVWSRRLALTATVWLNRESDAYAEPTFAIVERVIDEREPVLTKAVSWALRTLTLGHRDRVEAYLESRDERLAAHVRREVRNKLETGRKGRRTS